ncbi:MAG TPA: transposase [Candidatus Hydrogenedentes bacterium]|nr:transposase [Candidatus Hydrogenedentota bacterium]HPG66015.1 transposase [Candidatus Hydrogenedentota bacterium]
MSRLARVVVAGFPHHVTQRGNRGAAVFETDEDRETYLRILRKFCERHGLAIWAYCLMTNHIHLVAVPETATSLGQALRDAHTIYARYFNERTVQHGHVWQGRFYSCPMDEAHLWAAVRYVERNPVRARMAEHASEYRWSSAAAHCGTRSDALLSKGFPPPKIVEDWAAWLCEGEDWAAVRHIRSQTHTGRPCGSAEFVDELERLLGRIVRPQKRGRKAKNVPIKPEEDHSESVNS